MPRGPRGEKRPADAIGRAIVVAKIATGEIEDTVTDPTKEHHRRGGKKGANRRFTRLTNAFSKKIDNHPHALALYFAFYNFVRIHKTLKVTPAMDAGVTDKLWSLEDIAERIEADRRKPGKRGPYKSRRVQAA